MASTINASLTAGLVTTADTTGNLNLQSGGTTVVAVTSTGLAVTGTLSATTTLGVTGATTLAALSATTGAFSSTLSTTGGAAKAEAAASQAKSVVGAFNAGTAAATSQELITFAQAGTQKISHFWANSLTRYQIQTLTSGHTIALSPDTGLTDVLVASAAGVAVTGALSATTTLGVTGATTLAALSATTGAFSGAVNLDAGTVSLPGLYLEGETSTGLYRIGANNHGYAVSGAKVLDIASTGLSVTGTGTFTGNVNLANNTNLRALNTDGLTYQNLIGLTQEAPTNQIGIGDSTRSIYLLTNPSGFTYGTGGWFKYSDNGTYLGAGSGYHEFYKSTNDGAAVLQFSNAASSNPAGIEIDYPAVDPNDTSHRFILCQGGSGYTQRFSVRSNGGIANYSANDVNLSDVRMKKDIKFAGNYLDKICAIPVKTFLYKDQTDEFLNLGVIAQDVEAVAPELIDAQGFGDTSEDGVPLKAVYQTDLQYALMKAIQELAAKVAKLEAA